MSDDPTELSLADQQLIAVCARCRSLEAEAVVLRDHRRWLLTSWAVVVTLGLGACIGVVVR